MADEPRDPDAPELVASVTANAEQPQPPQPQPVVVEFPTGERRHNEAPRNVDPPQTLPAKPRPAWMDIAGLPRTKLAPNELRAARATRQRLCWQLWLKNVPTREIGRRLGISNKTAWYDIEAYRLSMNQTLAAPLARSRDMLVCQHAENQRGLWEIADNPQTSATNKILARAELTKSLSEVARLKGANMPIKVATTTPDGEAWAPAVVTKIEALLSIEELEAWAKVQRIKLGLLEAANDAVDGEIVGGRR